MREKRPYYLVCNHEEGPALGHQPQRQVEQHHGPERHADEAGDARAAVQLVGDGEGDAEVAAHCDGGEEQAAAVHRGEEEEVVDGAQEPGEHPALEEDLQGLDGQPGPGRPGTG